MKKSKFKIKKCKSKILGLIIRRMLYKKLMKILYAFEAEFAEFNDTDTFEKSYIFEALDYVLKQNGVKLHNGKR